LIDNPSAVIEIGSHTDSRGSDKSNEKLAQARAQSCVDYLVKEKGIDPKRLVAKGYGETKPLKMADGTVLTEKYIMSKKTKQEQESLHQLNRRTAFRVLSWDYVDPKAPQDQNKRKIIPKVNKGAFDDTGDRDTVETNSPAPRPMPVPAPENPAPTPNPKPTPADNNLQGLRPDMF
jgi:hypothetical protein